MRDGKYNAWYVAATNWATPIPETIFYHFVIGEEVFQLSIYLMVPFSNGKASQSFMTPERPNCPRPNSIIKSGNPTTVISMT